MSIQIKKKGSASAVSTTTHNKGVQVVTDHPKVAGFDDLLDPSSDSAEVAVSLGLTKNIGDFNSIRMDVSLRVPCDPTKVDEAFERAAKWCDQKLTDLQEG